jgi:hypothetical protein
MVDEMVEMMAYKKVRLWVVALVDSMAVETVEQMEKLLVEW